MTSQSKLNTSLTEEQQAFAGNKVYGQPLQELARLEALESYDILDSAPEADFDALTRLAAYICETPISLISLIDAQRQWFKSKLGLEVPETPREISFCQYAILQPEVFEVEDATRNDIFRENPLVTGEPNIRFYAGAPLITHEGFSLGTLCIIDTVPRSLSGKQKDALQSLARTVVTHLELRRARLTLENEKEKLENLLKLANSTANGGLVAGKSDIFVKQESKLVKVNTADILWVEALGDYVNIHTHKDRYTIYATMKDMETKLPGNEFVRVHRKYIISVNKIKSIEDDSAVIEKRDTSNAGHMMNGLMYVPIGSSYKTTLMKRLNLI
ncbi:GAF domain-containing DNA-binding protein [Adhaeribacter sp. BT258]|uniref:GAF domain-containing DNA-binding protein n=1 Tax=Adhaeribacter terrigena TaxID=2793070 RepID=A0ABS1BWZ8_9BACT|nr:GAF domain-containing DNA-binding protein [Adhaeribacter terrigena]MBK0401589.1 GAF domain-containing DNA-binding protein [Adhaeribacter terrigena]